MDPRDRNIPTVRQRNLGARLRALRQDMGLTVEEVAERLLCSPTKISRLETATCLPNLRDVRDLCTLYHVDDTRSAQLMEMARKVREPGWWTKYEDLDMPYIGLEQDAASITSYTMYYVPALLQTAEYTKAIIKGIAPKIDTKVLEDRIEARMERQKLLERDEPPKYRVLIDESVLCRPVGSRAVMHKQLGKVLEAGQKGKATIQVVPFELGAHAAQDSNFIFLEFGDDALPSIVFVEGLAAHQYLEKKEDIDRYSEGIEYLRDSALSPRESLQRIMKARDHYVGER